MPAIPRLCRRKDKKINTSSRVRAEREAPPFKGVGGIFFALFIFFLTFLSLKVVQGETFFRFLFRFFFHFFLLCKIATF